TLTTEAAPLSQQLKRIMTPASRSDILKEIERQGLPALETVYAALGAEDSDAEIGRDDAAAWLTIRHADRVFMYRLGARSRARPAITQRDAP
ncbi:hypothetical protein, partial [Salmonella sp. gx-h1]